MMLFCATLVAIGVTTAIRWTRCRSGRPTYRGGSDRRTVSVATPFTAVTEIL
jgi:hypothetical protein